MSQRIAIKRSGCFLPTLCLVAVVFVFGVLGWLCVVGLPDHALRFLEEKAEEQAGITLHLGAVKLSPSAGLALRAYNVRVEAPAAGLPQVSVRKATVACSWDVLFTGSPENAEVTLHGGTIIQPVEEPKGATLTVRNIDGRVTYSAAGGEPSVVSRLSADVQGVMADFYLRAPLSVATALDSGEPKPAKAADPAPVDYAALAEQIAPGVQRVYAEIERQQWQTAPQVNVAAVYEEGAEKPLDGMHLYVKASLPSYEVDDFHFRNAVADVEFREGTLVINGLSFETVDPETRVAVYGGYDFPNNLADVDVISSASLVRLAETYLDSDATGLLHKIRHAEADTPEIRLQGTVDFTEKFDLEHIRLQGSVDQKTFHIGETAVSKAHIAFFYEDGNFNLNDVTFTLPDGSIRLNALARGGHGDAEVEVDAPVEYLLALANEFAPVELPQEVNLRGRLNLSLKTALDTVVFRPGETTWEELVPDPRRVTLKLALGGLTAAGITAEPPVLEVEAGGLDWRNGVLESLAVTLKSDSVAAASAVAQQLAVRLHSRDLHLEQQEEEPVVRLGRTEAELAAAELHCAEHEAKDLQVKALAENGWNTAAAWQPQIAGLLLEAAARECRHGEDAETGEIALHAATHAADTAELHFRAAVGEDLLEVELPEVHLGENATRLRLGQARAALPVAALAPVWKALGAETDAILWPEWVTAENVAAEVDLEKGTLVAADARISVPKLVRTPSVVPVFEGLQIPVAVEAQLHFTPAEGEGVNYKGHLTVSHESGKLDADVEGNTARCVSVAGYNTISVPTLDRLIDDADAHEIMRDFRFPAGSSTVVNPLQATVTYDNGICVDVTGKADIRNTDYLMGAILADMDAAGRAVREHLRTDLGNDPYVRFKHASCGVGVQVYLNRKDAAGNPIADYQRINLTSPEIVYDNAPWFSRADIKGGKRETTVKGRSVVFDLDSCIITLNGLSGTAYPAYAFSAFYDPLLDFLKDLKTTQPVELETEKCVFPLSSTCKVPMGGVIRIRAPQAGFDFIGTTIPLESFSGYVNISDTAVLLDHMNARCWQGVLNAVVNIGFSGGSTTFDGYASASAMNLRHIAKSYDADLPDGLLQADIRFQAPSAGLESLRAYGNVTLEDSDLMQLKIFSPVGNLISNLPRYLFDLQQEVKARVGTNVEKAEPGFVTRLFSRLFSTTTDTFGHVRKTANTMTEYIPFVDHFMSYNIQDLEGSFTIGNGHLRTDDVRAYGDNVEVQMRLDLALDDMAIKGNIWPHIGSIPSMLMTPVSVLSRNRFNIHLRGTLDDLDWGVGLDKKQDNEPASLEIQPLVRPLIRRGGR